MDASNHNRREILRKQRSKHTQSTGLEGLCGTLGTDTVPRKLQWMVRTSPWLEKDVDTNEEAELRRLEGLLADD